MLLSQLRHPFEWLSTSGQNRAFILFLILSIVVMVSLQVTGAPLKTKVSPRGIISFEFAGELSLAQRMVESWGHKGQVYAGLNLGLDYLFLIVYACAIALGCVLVARGLLKRIPVIAGAGVIIAWTQLLAAVLDAVENYGLIRILVGTRSQTWPLLAKWCAGPKFVIVGTGIVYIISGVVLTSLLKEKA